MKRLSFLFLVLWTQNVTALDFMGWPNFNPVPEPTKEPEAEKPAIARTKRGLRPQTKVDWQPWQYSRIYRYRTGSRDAGQGKWERHIVFESRENVRLSNISCGGVKAPDVFLSAVHPVAEVVLLSVAASLWQWNASMYSLPRGTGNNR